MSRMSTQPVSPQQQSQQSQQTTTTKVPHDKIAMRAYDKWCQRGRPQGTQVQDWVEAERELQAECVRSGGQSSTQARR